MCLEVAPPSAASTSDVLEVRESLRQDIDHLRQDLQRANAAGVDVAKHLATVREEHDVAIAGVGTLTKSVAQAAAAGKLLELARHHR